MAEILTYSLIHKHNISGAPDGDIIDPRASIRKPYFFFWGYENLITKMVKCLIPKYLAIFFFKSGRVHFFKSVITTECLEFYLFFESRYKIKGIADKS